jgi:hypothetical protein
MTRVARAKLAEARCTVIAEATEAANQRVPDFDVRTAEVSEAALDVICPVDRRKRRSRQMLELGLVGALERDERSKESDVLGLTVYENDLQSSVGHRHRHTSNWHIAKW